MCFFYVYMHTLVVGYWIPSEFGSWCFTLLRKTITDFGLLGYSSILLAFTY